MKSERMVLKSKDGTTFTADVSVENEKVVIQPSGFIFPLSFTRESVRQIATRLIEMIDAKAPKQ